jgi:hypothetical protein
MARPEALVPGNCYFRLAFYDTDLRLPIVETLLYVGEDVGEDGAPMWLFKEPDAPAGPDGEAAPEPSPLFLCSAADMHTIVDFDGLGQWLREVAADHPLKPVPERTTAPATAEDFADVPREVASFLADPECLALTVTMRFVDRGLSLSRLEGGCSVISHCEPRRDPAEAEKILAFFDNLGIPPSGDYLSDRGRTRALTFPIAGDLDATVDLCRRVLVEVYSMRRGDPLDFHLLRRGDVEPRT